jgi:hypothetical protein
MTLVRLRGWMIYLVENKSFGPKSNCAGVIACAYNYDLFAALSNTAANYIVEEMRASREIRE